MRLTQQVPGLTGNPVAFGNLVINDLPIEIMSEIFILCLYDQGEFDPATAPMLLCQVSSYWRQIALSLPALWSSFSLFFEKDLPVSVGYELLVEAWLVRSRGHPLSFDLSVLDTCQLAIKNIFSLLIFNIDRWYNVTLALGQATYEQLLLASPGNWPRLVTFDLYFVGAEEQTSRLPGLLCQFPDLRNVAICSTRPASLNHYVTILAQCQNLVTCELGPFHEPVQCDHNNILLPALTKLLLDSNEDLASALGQITCPALCFLELRQHESTDSGERETLRGVQEFLSRSSCRLERFYLFDRLASPEVQLGYIKVPGLQTIRVLGISDISDDFLHALTSPPDEKEGDVLLPYLEGLELGQDDGSEDAVEAMARSRAQLVVLRTLDFHTSEST